jgi:hypothetical protein
MMTQLGGFLGRNSDGEPGVKTIWQGLQRVMTAADTGGQTGIPRHCAAQM